MDLHGGKPYWTATYPDAPVYPALGEDAECDVLIIGAGSTGAQCAYQLRDAGLAVIVADKRRVGHGSTLTNTGLIQYLGNKMLYRLVHSFGEETAVGHTRLCEQAVRDIGKAARELPVDCEFRLRDSLYAASTADDVGKLKREFELLVPNGFRVDWWSGDSVCDVFSFHRSAALYVRDDAEVNPYKYTIGLLEKARESGVRIFENTEITGRTDEPDAVVFRTADRRRIRAKQAIIAAGYETLEFKRDKNAYLTSTYAVVTEPADNLTDWFRRVLIWETARPYVYMRTTPDNRVIAGGLDEGTHIAADRDRRIAAKTDKLLETFGQLFPRIRVKAEYRFGAFYGETHDGLPMLARHPEFPRCTFVYAFEDNGLVHGMLMARLLREELAGTPLPETEWYRPGRRALVKSP